MKENTRVRVNHDFVLLEKAKDILFTEPYGVVVATDEYGIKVKLDLHSKPMYFYEEELEVIQ